MLGPMLDVAIGLVLIFVLYSVLLSAVLEGVATLFKLRARAFENGLISLLEDPMTRADLARTGWAHRIAGIFYTPKQTLAAVRTRDDLGGASFFDAVYQHPLVAGTSVDNRPSYISGANVALAVVYVLSAGNLDGSLASRVERGIERLPAELSTLKTGLVTIAQEACGDVLAFRRGVEAWFDSAMDRLSGDYKRFSHVCIFFLGLAVAVAANVDSIRIVKSLYAEPGLRAALTQEAETYVHTSQPPITDAGNGRDGLDRIAVAERMLLAGAPPVGWRGDDSPRGVGGFAMAALGWLLTALAGTMGAAFWFAMLLRTVNLRGTGPKPAAPPPAAIKSSSQ